MITSAPDKSLIIFGAGGHALSVASVALSAGYTVSCFVDRAPQQSSLAGIPVIGDFCQIEQPASHGYAIALGDNAAREHLYHQLQADYANLTYPALVHRSATVSSFCELGAGTVLMPQAVLGPNSKVGNFCIVNTHAVLDHDGLMEDFASLAPGAVCGGNVRIGRRSAVAIGAVVSHGLSIGADCVLGASSYLHQDLSHNLLAYGTPARIIRTRELGDPYLG